MPENESAPAAAGRPKVIVYSGPGCSACDQVKRFLAEHDVRFEIRDISDDESAQAELADMGFMAIPVTVIGEDAPILGADLKKIGVALGI